MKMRKKSDKIEILKNCVNVKNEISRISKTLISFPEFPEMIND